MEQEVATATGILFLCEQGSFVMDKVVYDGGCFQSFWGTPPTGLQGEFLTLQDLYQNQYGSLSFAIGWGYNCSVHALQ